MYLTIDFGGTKTLIAQFNDSGEIVKRHKFQTSGDYSQYLDLLVNEIESEGFELSQITRVAMAIPAPINYGEGTVRLERKMGEGWGNENIVSDLGGRLDKPVIVENDASVAALGEAVAGAGQDFERVLYVTLSTGIGTGYAEKGVIDPSLKRSEGGFMMMKNAQGQWTPWEHLASGKAFKDKYGQLGEEVNDPHVWREYADELAGGFINLMAVVQPEVIVVGGGMGAHLHKFEEFLSAKIEEMRQPPVNPVQIVSAKIPDDAVIYGLNELAKKHHD